MKMNEVVREMQVCDEFPTVPLCSSGAYVAPSQKTGFCSVSAVLARGSDTDGISHFGAKESFHPHNSDFFNVKDDVIPLHSCFALRRSIQERLEDNLSWAEKVLHTHWDKRVLEAGKANVHLFNRANVTGTTINLSSLYM